MTENRKAMDEDMKKKQILERCKTKTISLLMAGIMVFAMAPLGTGVAFADEENAEPTEPAVEAALDIDVEAPEAVVEEEAAEEEAAEPEVKAMEEEPREAIVKEGLLPFEPAPGGAQAGAGKLKDLGVYTLDLSNGVKKVYFDFEGVMSPEALVLFWMIQEGDGYFYGEAGSVVGRANLDVDGHGEAFDLEMYPDFDVTSPDIDMDAYNLCFNKLNTTNIKGSYTVMLTDNDKKLFDSELSLPEGYTGYYSGIKFVFSKAAPAKKANTLTLKANKMAKIKYKKLKKKAQSFNISKFVTVNGAQGAVTYAKASGNKKILVASNGQVTFKKKLKKGTYKVTVNVTAAGNANFNKVTKAVTFKVKVKK